MSEQNNNESEQAKLSAEQPVSRKEPGLLSIIQSVLAAMFGVQSEEKRAQDFESGHIGSYIFVGVVMVIIFILILVSVVNTILENSAQ